MKLNIMRFTTIFLYISVHFQISTSVHLILVKMVAHVWILLEVTDVIVKQDILETSVKQVITTS